MSYRWRGPGPCAGPARCYDAGTGAEVPLVFEYDPATHRLGRFRPGPGGHGVLIEGASGHLVEVWEVRPLRIVWADGTVEEPPDTPVVRDGPQG